MLSELSARGRRQQVGSIADKGVCDNTGGPAASTANTVWYQSKARNNSYGTYQLGARTYDPSTGTFTTPDTNRVGTPATDLSVGTDPLTANTYTYVNGNPINASRAARPSQGLAD